MKIHKAVITAAGRGVRLYPAAAPTQRAMLPLIDRDGLTKPVIQIIAEEAIESGIEEICVVCTPGDEERYRRQFSSLRDNLVKAYENVDWAQRQAEKLTDLLDRLHFAEQEEPRGYGHAVSCAREFTAGESFLLLLSDHLYISALPGKRCAQQLLETSRQEESPVAAVQATRESLVGRYGTVRGRRSPERQGLYEIEKILEKPSISQAEMELPTPGLRAGHYLCFFGMHVLSPPLFDFLEQEIAQSPEGAEVPLTPALNRLAQTERYLALEVEGRRYDIGVPYGLLQAQVALGMAGESSEQVLTTLVEVMAESKKPGSGSRAGSR